jgi:hypothetical protein
MEEVAASEERMNAAKDALLKYIEGRETPDQAVPLSMTVRKCVAPSSGATEAAPFDSDAR